jgi:hypothetical protein
MTISSSGPISLGDIATEYDLSLNNLDFVRMSKIARLPSSRDIGSFRGTSANDFTGKVDYYQRVTGVADADTNGLEGALGSVRALVNMSDATTGVIFEVGASGVGFVLYVHSGTIYAQYGDGDVVGGDYEVSYTVPSTWTTDETHEIVVSCDSRGYGLVRMYIDGILVSTEYNATPTAINDIAGTDDAGTGKVHSVLAYTRMNPTDNSSEGSFPFTGGTIRSVSTYRQVTAVPLVDNAVFISNTYSSGVAAATNILVNQKKVTIITNVTIDKDSTGVIYESGGSGIGLALYAHGGKLYIKAGDGGVLSGTISTSWTIPDYISASDRTEIIASAEITSTSSRAKLFVNNREVATSTSSGSNSDISGSDSAGTGRVYNSMRYTELNPDNASSDGSLQYTGTIYDTQVYSGIFHPYATGGTITDVTIGGITYRVHTFTTVGTSTLIIPETRECDILIVAGGGGGGGSAGGGASGGGGGAGGLILDLGRTVTGGTHSIVVGGGGTAVGSVSDTRGGNGGNSSAFTLTAVGGGGGGCRAASNDNNANGLDGGSGGGEGSQGVSSSYGSGTTGQGNRGGLDGFSGNTANENASGGGGGAGSVGGNGLDNNYSGDGGIGLDTSSYFTTAFGDAGWFAGGGGGGRVGSLGSTQGSGGLGGGGDGGNTTGVAGAAQTGGGGGGAGGSGSSGAGGSGIVLIRYRID